MMSASRQFTHSFLQKAATLVMETDRKMKTSVDDAQRLLEMLIMELAMEARNG